MIKKNINCKAKQRKTKAYLKWKLLEMPQTKKKKRWWWKPKLAQHNSSTKIVVCEVVFYEEKMLMTTHNTMQQQDTMKKMLIMKCKAKNQEFKFANEQGVKILKTNKHKV